jgi:ABC-type glycerol-3-phosphate transport system substrate-binding protein
MWTTASSTRSTSSSTGTPSRTGPGVPWTHDGRTLGLPLEAATVELYYNRDKLAELGFDLPETKQLDGETFKALVERAVEAGITPIVQGNRRPRLSPPT